MDAEQSENLESLAFLTLAQIFRYFDKDDNKIGFNIEIKYPQLYEVSCMAISPRMMYEHVCMYVYMHVCSFFHQAL